MKRGLGIAALVVVGLCATIARAADKPDATLSLHGGSVAAGVGVVWQSGTLSYQGKEYPVEVRGVSVGDVGVAKIDATGEVYDLGAVPKFNGKYAAVGAGATVVGGRPGS
jgi:hypothetical protein